MLLPLFAFGQETPDNPIVRVNYKGLKKTKESHLNNVLRLPGNGNIDPGNIPSLTQRLQNLNSIARATATFDTTSEVKILTFEVEEARTLFPIVNFGSIRGNFWYQLGFNDINWFGKGMQLSAFYRNNDNRNNFNLFYRVPYIKGSRWGASASVLRWASVEPLFFDEGEVRYAYTNLSFSLSGIREFSTGHTLEFGGSYFIEEYEKTADQPLESPPGPEQFEQPKLLAKLVSTLDRIDYNYHELNGFENRTIIEGVYNLHDRNWFWIVLNDLRYFKKIGWRSNLGLRLRLGLSSNVDSPFAPFVLDSNVNIRGSGNRIDRGTAQAILNLEFRQTLWDPSGGNFALQLVGFSDLGTWRNPGGTFSDLVDSDNFRHFVGGGARLVYKRAFNAILRVDYGVDLYNSNQRGFVLGIGQYF